MMRCFRRACATIAVLTSCGMAFAQNAAPAKVIPLSQAWRIATDSKNVGRQEQWFAAPRPEAKPAAVPGTMQQSFPGYHGVAWYWTEFEAPAAEKSHKWQLHFGSVDYLAEVWLNGKRLGDHEGTDGPFDLDATDALKPAGKNLLAVRVLNPGHQSIDGFVIQETPHSFKQADDYQFGGNANSGGFLQPVELRMQPSIRITDVFVNPNMATGEARIQITVENASGAAAECLLKTEIRTSDNINDISQCASELKITAQPGKSQQNVTLQVKQPRLWSTKSPNLYTAAVTIEAAMPENVRTVHQTGTRFGYRDFRVGADGYFRLNGKKLFLKSCHTVNNFPVAIGTAHKPEIFTRDLLYAKGMGYDMVRFLGGPPLPKQLAFCDEIGLMIYAEPRSGWCLGNSPKMAERYDISISQMILRDRNHPCITIWGMLNETGDKAVVQHAVDTLPLVRKLDDSRLVLFHSGRQFDNTLALGSLSNPGSKTWEYLWGDEAPNAKNDGLKFGFPPTLGDLHNYPAAPHDPGTIGWFRNMSGTSKPIFLSEYGVGSLVNPYRIMRRHDEDHSPNDLLDFAAYRSMAERLAADMKKYGMDNLYPFPEDLIFASERMHARHRTIGYNAIRSNPRLCGYSLTGIIDQPAGEGLMTEWRELKQGIMDAMNDCLAPLRWCLFIEPMHAYAGRPFKIEAVMANDGVLASGEYPARLKIFGPAGVVWEKSTKVVIPAADSPDKIPLVTPVLTENVTLNGPAGVYTFAAELERGGVARGERVEFYLSKAEELPRFNDTVAVLGIAEDARKWLKDHGVSTVDFNDAAAKSCRVVVVGDGPNAQQAPATWRELVRRMATGDAVVFLKPTTFAEGQNTTRWLPLKNKGVCRGKNNWVYHCEDVAKQHPMFDGLPAGGMLNWYYYLQVSPNMLFEGQDMPEEAVAAAFGPGDNVGNGYNSGLLVGSYRFGAGRFYLNTLRILENLNANPAADRLLLNMIRTAAEIGKTPKAELPPDFEAKLKEIGY